jgi:tripartite-type tricarboxylate transporter receptor subunit TctC
MYGSTGIGSGTHYGAELFRLAAKFDATHVPYKGVLEAFTDTLAGRVNFYLPPVLVAVPLVRDGRILALMISNKQRAPLLPDVPTPVEAGLSEFEYDGWYGMLAPGYTPRAIVDKVSKEMARILDLPDIKEHIVGIGGTAKWSSPAVFERMIRSEIETRSKIFKASGSKVE